MLQFYAAVYNRALLENGLRIRDKMAVVTDPRSFPKRRSLFQRLGITKYAYISIFDSVERQTALLRDFKPDAIKGYASSLLILAAEINGLEREIKPRLVFTSAELLEDSSRKIISSAFDAELFNLYACSEFSLLALECKAHDGYHINADSVLMEFLDGEAVASGEKGMVVCAGLYNDVMPLIRYELKDVADPSEGKCSCGVSLPLIKSIEGRADDFLVATDGRLISPTVFFPYPFDSVDWIRQFRVIQEGRRKLVIQVAPKKAPGAQSRSQIIEAAERKIRGLFGEDMEVSFDFVDEIPLEPSGKLRKVISRINSGKRFRLS